jgi:ornithine cyclodeaminase/alanine dehydrogenase-like protein (mu-crystallin family)
MLILSQGDLHSLLTMRDVIAAVEGAFLALARGDASQPERLHLELPEARGVLLEMPSYLRGQDAQV